MRGWESSPTIGAVSAALVEAVGNIESVAKTRTAKVDSRSGSGYSYKYADLSDVIASTKATLRSSGLVALQTVASDDTSVVISTTLLHTSGEWIAFDPLRLPLGRTAQEIGSAITYGRRYALLACLGIAAEDDDGASAAPRTIPAKTAVKNEEKPADRTPEETEIRRLLADPKLGATISRQVKDRFIKRWGTLLASDPAAHKEMLAWTILAIDEATSDKETNQ